MTSNSDDVLQQLSDAGVAIWLDDISRERLTTGNLATLIRDMHVVGVTSNPTIFAHALSSGTAYDDQIADLALRGVSVGEASRAITTFDIRWACDVFRPDTRKTIAEARALWWQVDRPNLFIKIPATPAGLPAITACLAEGISINVTLIFSLARYGEVIDAFMAGLEQAATAGHDLSSIYSVASFFVSRVDTEVDNRLDKLGTPEARELRGKAAIANTRLAYELYEQRFGAPRWEALRSAGANPQRPLWASTSTKDPEFDDTMYVVDLVAPGIVNTMPEATLHAVAAHGKLHGNTAAQGYDEARQVIADLERLGISYDDVVTVLEDEGVAKFAASWDGLLETIKKEMDAQGSGRGAGEQ
jgi:transaldolase